MLVNESKSAVQVEPEEPGFAPGLGAGIARGAAIVAGLTVLARLLGLVRTLVFSQTVGATCLGGAYVTANQIPNLLYELVLGGALTSAMVPVLARSAERADRDPAEKARVGAITSALLTWSADHPGAARGGYRRHCGADRLAAHPRQPQRPLRRSEVVAATGHILAVFAPQALFYGLSVVLYGLLQSYRRFAAPSIGPGVSSLVLIASYVAFVPLNNGRSLANLPISAELGASVGTTFAIAALVVVALPPTLAAARAAAAGPAIPSGGGAPGGRPGPRRLRRARRRRSGQRRDHRPWPTGAERPARWSCSTTARRCSTP